jgi:heme-degrading monooxygenase HmoA
VETLHALLLRPYPGHNEEVLRQLGFIAERLPPIPGLLAARFFRSREEDQTYLAITTWEGAQDAAEAEAEGRVGDEDASNASEVEYARRLTIPGLGNVETEEWFLQYSWGFSRAEAETRHALVLIATSVVGPQSPQVRQGWRSGLHALAAEAPLGHMFLAVSIPQEARRLPAPIWFCFLGCSTEQDVEIVRTHPLYERLVNWVSRFTQVRSFALATLSPDYRAPI